MRKLIPAAVLLLTGCIMNKLQANLAPLVGQDIHIAIKKLGYPTSSRVIVGDTVYTWTNDWRAPYPCTVTLVAGPNDIIKTTALEGTEPGCKHYNDAFDE